MNEHDGEYRFVRHEDVERFKQEGWSVSASLEGTPHHKWSVIMKKEEGDVSLSRKELAEHVGNLVSNERNVTHGSPHEQFACQRAIIEELRRHAGYDKLGPTEHHALEMITTKLSRIVCGSNSQDHWIDCVGYALIAAEVADNRL